MLLKTAVDTFLVYLEAKGDSQRTIATYNQRLNLFVVDTGLCREAELRGITPELIDQWVAGMRRRNLANDTIRSRVRDVKHFFRWCKTRGYLERSPSDHLNIRGRAQLVVKAMTPETLKRMLEAANHDRDRALIRFIASTGCRAGEAANLQMSDLNLAKREAVICGKTGPRFVDFDQDTGIALAAWLDNHPSPDQGVVFVGLVAPHRPVSPSTIYQVFRRLAITLGIESERFNPHSVRHLVGKKWVEETNLELARQKLGHADISTTAAYANQDRDRVKHYTDKLKIIGS